MDPISGQQNIAAEIGGHKKKVTSWKFTSSPWKDPPIFLER